MTESPTSPRYTDPLIVPHESTAERESREQLTELLRESPVPPEYLIDNLPVYLRRGQLSDLLTMDALYRQVREVPGVIMEFGVLHGRHLAAFTALRGIYEPQNSLRRIIGFDTFTGFPDINRVDEVSPSAVVGRFRTSEEYPQHLREVLRAHELGEHLGHVQRSFVVQGDVRESVPRYLEENPHTVIALAYFDLDLYEPTRDVLRMITPYLAKGSIVAFDELAHPKWPGETAALREVLDLSQVRLEKIDGREPPVIYLRWNS
ncbi:class I SAM-dependent methyltransferase [Kineosporia babensis]|uniref:Class I SAM-dependent methyltransferase n=1 Tax=Kineosporia babensis TaxID=499548 RepID=A0A9X1NL05_9ACTN|nr:class I SAM-dependent methyltransferase [Kineosporia babensis]MCD5315719.1 class I SAM-dependent methyltransferase [Kineosporia babensis]